MSEVGEASEVGVSTPGVHRHQVFIQESHLDTFGHVNNATYLVLFEEARWGLITAQGLGLSQIRESRIGPVILEVNVKYRREVLNRETITIVSEVVAESGLTFQLLQRAMKADGRLACEALFVMAVWDLDARKLVSPPPAWRRLIDTTRPVMPAEDASDARPAS